MLLPADRRRWFEAGCRTAAVLVLAGMLYRALIPSEDSARAESRNAAISELTRVSVNDLPSRIHFDLDGIPSPTQRAWQRALRGAGSKISWSGNLEPIAISIRPVAAPSAQSIVTATSFGPSAALLRDDISTIDSASGGRPLISASLPIASGRVRVVSGNDSAYATASDSAALKSILVIGKANWETKFVLAALEEAGWKTEAAISVAPSIAVTQGSIATIDTAHYSAVVALDESADSRAASIRTFVRSGGGLILGDAAARTTAFTALRVSEPGSPPRASTGDTVTRALSAFAPLRVGSDAIAVEQNKGMVSVAAKRVEFGRVIQIGYADTWKWRLQGPARGIDEHRDWWSHLLAQVAHASRSGVADGAGDPAPYSDLVNVAGLPSAQPQLSKPLSRSSSELLWMLGLFTLLLVEWASRRLRGAR